MLVLSSSEFGPKPEVALVKAKIGKLEINSL